MKGKTRAETNERRDRDGVLLEARNLKKHYPVDNSMLKRLIGGVESVKAVDGVDITIGTEETLGIVGESGCGKSSLGRTLARLYEPTDGEILFEGKDISDIPKDELKAMRKDIQVIFQDPLSSLNPRKTAGEIVAQPMKVHGIASGKDRQERVLELFEEVGLNQSHTSRYPHEFSGGQRQRIGIARALAVEPKLIIADEPVSALDVSVQAQIINMMKRLQQEYELSYLFIAHDLSVVKHISDDVAVMYLGKVVEKGSTDEIFSNPRHPYTRALMDAIPTIGGHGLNGYVMEGNPPSPINPPSGCSFHTRCPEYIGEECDGREPSLQQITTEVATTNGELTEDHVVACHWNDRSEQEREQQNPFSGE